MIILPATAQDASRVARLHIASWRDAYQSVLDPDYLSGPVEEDRLAFWHDRLLTPRKNQRVLLAVDRAAVLGFVCVINGEDEKWGSLIDNLHTEPSARGNGIGAALLKSAAAWVEQRDPTSGLHLYVFEANIRARQFYERHGARPAGQITSEIPSARRATLVRLYWRLARSVI
jgi:GNAT superfamily N-acetyltransferase